MADIRYAVGAVGLRDLNQELDSLWRELQDPKSALRREAEAKGVDLQKVSGLPRQEAITVRQEGEGFDPVTTAIIVAFSPGYREAFYSNTPWRTLRQAAIPRAGSVEKRFVQSGVRHRRAGEEA